MEQKRILIVSITLLMASTLPTYVTSNSDTPEWWKRTDIEVSGQQNEKPRWSIETIQPIHENTNNTYFVQGRIAHKNKDETFNLGFGYRHILDDKSLMYGVNAFYDQTNDENHQRVGVGLELFHPYATYRANFYDATSGTKNVRTVNSITDTERALDGWDVSIETPIPYVPWATFNLQGFEWDGYTADDVDGYTALFRMHPTGNLEIETGYSDADNNDFTFINLIWHFDQPTHVTHTASDGVLASTIMVKRDLEKHRLEKVRRHNDIVLEKRRTGGAGIVIGRGT